MKRYKDLDAKKKKRAVDYMFQRIANKELYKLPGGSSNAKLKDRLKEIQEQIKFCGCTDCFNKYSDIASKDPQVKEIILSDAMDAAEQAYYPEDDDNIIKVN